MEREEFGIEKKGMNVNRVECVFIIKESVGLLCEEALKGTILRYWRDNGMGWDGIGIRIRSQISLVTVFQVNQVGPLHRMMLLFI